MLKIITFTLLTITLTACSNQPPTDAGNPPKPNETNTVIVTLHENITTANATYDLRTLVNDVTERAWLNANEVRPQTTSPATPIEVIHGFIMNDVPESVAAALLTDERVSGVEWDSQLSVDRYAVWGLDRIDQRTRPLDSRYLPYLTGANVRVYVMDSGIRSTHSEFGGRVTSGFTTINDGRGTEDCNGHGTHVAGTIGGITYGAAPGVTLTPVRVLKCDGGGWVSDGIKGLNWILNQPRSTPSVVNVSMGGRASSAFDTAVRTLYGHGILTIVAAGNDNRNACNYSPAREPRAITVAASTKGDVRSPFSNFGRCVDVFAPGSDITSAAILNDNAFTTYSGTSMAAPHVTGVAALHLQNDPAWTPAQLTQLLLLTATQNVIASPGTNTPNRLLYTDPNLGSPTPNPDPEPDPEPEPEPEPEHPTNACGTCTTRTITLTQQQPTAYTEAIGYPFGTLTTTIHNPEKTTTHTTLERLDDNTWTTVKTETTNNETHTFILNNLTGTHRYRIHTNAPTTITIHQRHAIQSTIRTSGGNYITTGFPLTERTIHAHLSGPTNTNYDLRLERREGNLWRPVAASLTPNSEETITTHITTGTYRWRVQSRTGTGTFTLRTWSD